MTNRTLTNLRRRLERAELDLLRQVVAEQAARIESLEAELDDAMRDTAAADAMASMFQDMLNEALDSMPDAPQVGITQAGNLLLVSAHSPAH